MTNAVNVKEADGLADHEIREGRSNEERKDFRKTAKRLIKVAKNTLTGILGRMFSMLN